MDKAKQPGISFDGIILVKEDFWRDFNVSDDAEIKLKFNSINNLGETNATVEITLSLELVSHENSILRLDSTFVGFFSIIKGEENMEMKDYLENHAPALLFPYIREHISTVTMKAGIKPVLLRPINLVSLLSDD
jgi:preprotein translocase subunit SecB